jgi:hypothetical protein
MGRVLPRSARQPARYADATPLEVLAVYLARTHRFSPWRGDALARGFLEAGGATDEELSREIARLRYLLESELDGATAREREFLLQLGALPEVALWKRALEAVTTQPVRP